MSLPLRSISTSTACTNLRFFEKGVILLRISITKNIERPSASKAAQIDGCHGYPPENSPNTSTVEFGVPTILIHFDLPVTSPSYHNIRQTRHYLSKFDSSYVRSASSSLQCSPPLTVDVLVSYHLLLFSGIAGLILICGGIAGPARVCGGIGDLAFGIRVVCYTNITISELDSLNKGFETYNLSCKSRIPARPWQHHLGPRSQR